MVAAAELTIAVLAAADEDATAAPVSRPVNPPEPDDTPELTSGVEY
jgi:hypothetical protein